MAARLVQELERQHAKIERNAHNPAALTRAFVSVSELLPSYFSTSVLERQSPETLESRARHSWRWVELPQFPLRRFLPLAARALCRFPEHKGLVLILADLCTDYFKQNMMAKVEAMRCGILQGLCAAAGQLALSESFSQDDVLIAERIFGALRKVVEPASIRFYSLPVDVKDEFYSVARSAWGKVNVRDAVRVLGEREGWESFDGPPAAFHVLLLTLHYFKKCPDMMALEHYLEVLRNVAEAFENTYPTVAENAAFSRFVKETLETARGPRQPQSMMMAHAQLLDEALLIYKRTLNRPEVPWNHRDPALLPALNRQYQAGDIFDTDPLYIVVENYNEWRSDYREMVCRTARQYVEGEANDDSDAPGTPAPADDVTGGDPPGPADAQARTRRGRACAQCSRRQSERPPGQPAFKKCSRCRSVFYCGPDCQRLHWREHRQVCVAP